MSDYPYPTGEQLQTIRSWSPEDLCGWMDFIHGIWAYADDGYWTEEELKVEIYVTNEAQTKQMIEHQKDYYISTAGWSGNEEIIDAMMQNHMMWSLYWDQSNRGGHFIFKNKPFVTKTS